MAKGAGMLAPSLATMLVVITTDAAVPAAQLDSALRAATARTFDRLDVDGSCSTNDTVLLLASGASEITPDAEEFAAAVARVCDDLAAQLQSDAPQPLPMAPAATVRVPAAEASAADDASLSVEDRSKKQWDADASLRTEFGTLAAYTAFAKAQDRGAVRMLVNKKG